MTFAGAPRREAAIAIVGAGPAGAVAALTLARAGHDVALIDRHAFPRAKACGDALSRSAVSFLAELGLGGVAAGAHPIGGARLFVDWEQRAVRRWDSPIGAPVAGCLSRRDFDHALVEQARGAGARLLRATARAPIWERGRVAGVEVLEAGRPERVLARHLIVADGATSRLGRQLRGDRRPSGPARPSFYGVRGYVRTERELEATCNYFVPLHDSLVGYGWLFPVADRVANVGIGCGAEGARPPRSISDLLARFIAELELRLRGELGALGQLESVAGAPVAIGFDPEGCEIGGAILVGDAARTCDLLTGEGIDQAMRSGHAAALALDRSIRRAQKLVGIGRSIARSNLRLGQDPGMFVRYGQDLLRRAEGPLSAEVSAAGSRMPLIASMVTMTFADIAHPGLAETPSGQMARRVGAAERMRLLDGALRDRLSSEFIGAAEILYRDVCSAAGPVGALLLFAGEASFGRVPAEQALRAALAVELLRALPRVLGRLTGADGHASGVNNGLVTMIGDHALALASVEAAKLGTAFSAILAEAIEACGEAVALRARDRFDLRRTAAGYVEFANLHAGSSLTLAGAAAALLAGADQAVADSLAVACGSLGVAVQIAEDISALRREDPVTGYRPRHVLEQGDFSLPVICALQAQPELAPLLSASDDPAHWERALAVLRAGPGIARATELCGEYAAAAKEKLVEIAGRESPLALVCDLPLNHLGSGG